MTANGTVGRIVDELWSYDLQYQSQFEVGCGLSQL